MQKTIHSSPGHYISAIYRHLQIHLNHQFSTLGFGSGQYLFFHHISRNEGISQKDLSRALAIDKATTAKAVHKLTAEGYIEQRQSKEDKRYNNLYLTVRGKDILPAVKDILKQTHEKLHARMSDKESESALRLMNIMLENITAETGSIRRDSEQ